MIGNCLLTLNQKRLHEESTRKEMGDTNELMEFLSASLGATLDEIYQRLIDCDFTREDPGLAMFVGRTPQCTGKRGSRESPYGSSVDVGLR